MDAYLKDEGGETRSKGSEVEKLDFAFSTLRARVERAQIRSQFVALSELASTLSHELKNPLAVALLAVDDLDISADQKEVEILKRALQRMREVIARHTQTRSSIFGHTNFDDLSSDALILYGPLFEERGVKLEVQNDGSLGLPFDRITCSQIIGNLLKNALDASQKGMTVRLRGSERFLQVEDQGEGFDQATLARALELGFTTKKNGQGVGLAFVHELVLSVGGQITLSNSSNKGAIVTLDFLNSTFERAV